MNEFVIDTKLPSLNEVINKNRTNVYVGAKYKKDIEFLIGFYIKKAVALERLKKPVGAVIVEFDWHERTMKRDADNIASAKKFILDALQKQGILKNDNRKFVVGFHDRIIDDDKDFVVVRLLEIEEVTKS